MNTSVRFSLAACCIVFIFCWILFVGPRLQLLPKDFSYTADVISLDNFYDQEKKEYLGQTLSVTEFGFQVKSTNKKSAEIVNTFDVRTIDGNPIFAVERNLRIDRKNWKHIQEDATHSRKGMLFGPKGKSPRDYTYWHVNYDTPANMKFVAKEHVFGLPVHRYKATFQTDQTANLHHLPGVPEQFGIELDVQLETWIEPISGYLVQYKDKSTGWFYRQETKERMHPWNSFQNSYTVESIRKNVSIAQAYKMHTYIIRYTIPSIVFALVFMLLAWTKKRVRLFVLFGTILAFLGCIVYLGVQKKHIPRPNRVTIGIASWSDSEQYAKNISAFKKSLDLVGYKEGHNITFYEENAKADDAKQKSIIDSFIQKNVDLIYSLTTPGTLIAKEHAKNIPVVFSVVTYPLESGIVKSLQRSGVNAVGTRNWIPVSEQLSTFLLMAPNTRRIGFAYREGELNSTIQLSEMENEAQKRNMEIVGIPAKNLSDLTKQLQAVEHSLDALYGACDTLIQAGGEDVLIAKAKELAIADFTCLESGVQKGSLVGLVTDFSEIGFIAGNKAQQILSGVPANVLGTDVGLASKLLINQKRANELGIVIPTLLQTKAHTIYK